MTIQLILAQIAPDSTSKTHSACSRQHLPIGDQIITLAGSNNVTIVKTLIILSDLSFIPMLLSTFYGSFFHSAYPAIAVVS